MKTITATPIQPRKIRVEFNNAKTGRDQWCRIRDAVTGEILHTGQLAYIRNIAKRRYLHKVSI